MFSDHLVSERYDDSGSSPNSLILSICFVNAILDEILHRLCPSLVSV